MFGKWKHAAFIVAEKLLRWCVVPAVRATLLRFLGATVGRNVRISECQFFNLRQGFSNLRIADDVFVGPGCLIDLEGVVDLRTGATLGPRVTVITHNDPGSSHGSPLVLRFPPLIKIVTVGAYAWIGAGATLLPGAEVGDLTVVGAMALVKGHLDPGGTYVGVPAKKLTGEDLK